MYMNAGLGAVRNPRHAYLVNRRGMGAVVLPVPGFSFVRRGGLGDCSQMPGVSYSNISGAVCRDNATGNIVACSAPSCSAPAAAAAAGGGWAPTGPSFVPAPVIESINVGGFTGTIPVPTLASRLGDMLAAKESPFNANLIAKGVVNPSVDAQDFAALALEHCTQYAASQGCNNPQAVAAQFVNQYMTWLKGQSAAAYHAGDTGSLAAPTVITNRDPVAPAAPVPPNVAAAQQSAAGGTGAGAPGAAGSGSGSGSAGGGGAAAPSGGALPSLASFSALLNKTFSIAGYNVPVWGAGAVLGGLWLFSGSKQ